MFDQCCDAAAELMFAFVVLMSPNEGENSVKAMCSLKHIWLAMQISVSATL